MNALTRRDVLRTMAGVAGAGLLGPLLAGCDSGGAGATSEIVLYTSVDQPIAVQVIAAFEKSNPSAKVRLVTDTEAMKSVGLATKLMAEKERPVCHVWWGNEPFHTIELANAGLFEPMSDATLNEIEPLYKDAQNRWAGNGLRVRVMAVGESVVLVKGSLEDLLDPQFKGKVGLARPLAGTTGGHVAALYALWGDAKADEYFRALKANGAVLLGGNGEVAQQVGNGNLKLGLTDNDDVHSAQRNRGELWEVVPDQFGDGIGTLAIPTTVALVKRDNQPAAAKALASFLLSDAVEEILLDQHFAAHSVRRSPDSVKTMNVKYEDIARRIATTPKRVADIFDDRA